MSEREDLAGIVGSENVFDDPETLEEYSQDMSFFPPRKPHYVVKPENKDEVQAIVEWANKTGTPLVPVSSGPPHFRGDTIPSFGGVVVDMSNMRKIIKIDRPNRVAMIEPGVRFGELQETLRKEGVRLPMPLSPRNSKSVIGSCLEREPHIIPKYHLDFSEPLLCTEVIFGTGDLFYTGEASGPGTIEEQWKVGRVQKVQLGPGMVGYNKLIQGAQGTMGIVTWATVRCEILPRIQKPFLVASERIETLIDFTYKIVRLRLGDECLILNSVNLASLLTDVGIEALREALPPWVLFFCVAGYEWLPDERVAYQEKDMMEVAREFGLNPVATVPGAAAWDIMHAVSRPSNGQYWKLRQKGACEDIFFITTLDKTPQFVETMLGLMAGKGYPVANMGIYVQPVNQGHNCHCEFNLTYDATNARESAEVKDTVIHASETLMRMGAFFSRPYGQLADMVYNRDAASRDALKKVKQIFDPNNIMNPGKLCF